MVRLVAVGAAVVFGLPPAIQAQPTAQGPPAITVTGQAEHVSPLTSAGDGLTSAS